MLRKLLGKLLGSSNKKDAGSTSTSSASPHRTGHTHGRGSGHGGKHGGGGGAGSGKPHGKGSSGSAHGKHGHASGHAKTSADGDRRTHGSPAGSASAHGKHGSSRHGTPKGPGNAGPGSAARGHAGADDEHAAGDRPRRRRRGGRGRGRDRERGPHGAESAEARASEPSRESSRGHHRSRHEAEFVERSAVEGVAATREPSAPAAPIEIPPVSPDNDFSDLGLEPFIVAAVETMGYLQPTPIQSEAIPVVLSGRDVIGSAQTGTGKTAAFGLPILQRLRAHGDRLRCLVLEPTRELASQVEEAFLKFSKFTDLRTAVMFGGVGYGPQREALRRGLDVVVATPGRLLDHISQGDLSLSNIEYLVLDEVDRMLDMGFLPDVKRIIEKCPRERQTLFFSATIPPELDKLTQWVLRDPHTIEIGRRRSPAETVSHAFYPVIEAQKFDLLLDLLERTHYESVLIFCRTKHGADFVAGRLNHQGHKVAVMHSNRSQSERMEALQGFKSGKYEVMVATDLAARGLDIAGITHVINYDTPLHAEDYVHRIGRTGRAQAEGDAFTLLTEEETKYAASIEHFIGQKVERKKLENFPYQYSAVFASMEGGAKNVFRSRLYRGTRG